MNITQDLCNAGIIQKMTEICLGEEFCFMVKEIETEFNYHIGVKCIEEFSTLLLLVGNHGGGFNMVFLANDNIENREEYLKEAIQEEFEKALEGCRFIGFCDND